MNTYLTPIADGFNQNQPSSYDAISSSIMNTYYVTGSVNQVDASSRMDISSRYVPAKMNGGEIVQILVAYELKQKYSTKKL